MKSKRITDRAFFTCSADSISIHPYKPYIPDGATKLIIGTMPPFRFCNPDKQPLYKDDVDFYYGSRDNGFWKLISESAGSVLQYANTQEAIAERKNLLARLHMGVTDIIASCVHEDCKSDDASLKEITQKDLCSLLLEHPEIDTLIYTSRFVTKQVNKVADKHYHEHWNKEHHDGTVLINHKNYTVHILYSPSPNALRGVDENTRLERYKKVFAV